MYPDSSEELNRESDESIYFFTPAFHPLDNYSAHRIDLWGYSFPTAEHAYQWKKYSDDMKIAKLIIDARSPEAANRIGKKYKDQVPRNWHDQKVNVMKQILRAKTEQNEDVRLILKNSGNKEIIENSPVDDFWGNGPDNNGLNNIGKIWMELRKEI